MHKIPFRYILPFFIFLFTFLIYIHHLSPSVYGGDVGDFVTAAFVKGVPHPSGYPLFTILAILFTYLPFTFSVVLKIGLISVISASATVVILYFLINTLTKNRIAACFGGLTLAFVYPFWLYAELAEVFAFTYLFFILLFSLAILFHLKKERKFLYLLSFFSGLSLANHEVTLLLFPSLLFLVVATDRKIFLKPVLLFQCLLLFLCGLLPYGYIPIAASRNPLVNWDNAVTLQNFLHLVLRRDYGNWIYQPDPDYIGKIILPLVTYFSYFFIEFSPILLFLNIFGMIYLWKKKMKTILIASLCAIFFTGPFFFTYGSIPVSGKFTIGVFERFYVISGLYIIFLSSFGVIFCSELLQKRLSYFNAGFRNKKKYQILFPLLFLIVPTIFFIRNFSKTDLHDVWIGDNYARHMLMTPPKKSIFLVRTDNAAFNVLYMHVVNGIRPDISVHLPLIQSIRDNDFLKEYAQISQEDKNNSYVNMYLKTAMRVSKRRPFFSSVMIQFDNASPSAKIDWIPYGLLYKLADDSDRNMSKNDYFMKQKKIWDNFSLKEIQEKKPSVQRSLLLSDIIASYVYSAIFTGNYLVEHYNDLELAKYFYQKAIDIDPENEIGYEGIGIYYLRKDRCLEAKKYFSEMLKINQWSRAAYERIYLTEKYCFKNNKGAESVTKKYQSVFHSSFEKEFKTNNDLPMKQ